MDFDNVIIIVIIGFFFSHCSSHNKHTLGTNAVPNIQLHPRHTKHSHTHTEPLPGMGIFSRLAVAAHG